jgi:glutamyl-tRNA reductase
MEELARALTNKLLHAPTHALGHASPEERETLATTLARLYRIE